MSDNVLLYIIGMALITYLTRFPMLLISSRWEIPVWLKRGLAMVPVGVFSSMTIPPILFHAPEGEWSPEYLVAGIVSLSVGIWKKQIVWALLAGVVVIALWRQLVEWM
ncbi:MULTISPECIES: AzlD domain-containing protein [Brevibacillus]|jgi:branched-subunit amino acid transport protein|uniref:AzlD domain-containing protein n=1 Tax=Brevibacillus TaxID=55080 RepID=UPI00262C0EF2|nr:AzlD domain-containing protein [Brevibacillus nitrificans]MED1794606.1 AzlD domain-containing protein [Brevibacillus nitrificans]